MKKSKSRYSIPDKVVGLLYTDENFFNEVMKLKKVNSGSKFPKSDEWRDELGFNISFALAGYSPDDVSVDIIENTLVVRGKGLDSVSKSDLEFPYSDDAFAKYSKKSKPRVHIGSISRGIARRSFCVKLIISHDFRASDSEARMENGLLHIFIPESECLSRKSIEIWAGTKK